MIQVPADLAGPPSWVILQDLQEKPRKTIVPFATHEPDIWLFQACMG